MTNTRHGDMMSEQSELPGMGANPARYRKLSEPFPSHATAGDAMEAFVDAVRKAREEHGIPDVVIGFQLGYLAEDGEILQTGASMNLGDSLKAEAIAAYTFGQMAEQRKQMVDRALKLARKA